ncbi:PKD domain-containing protein [Aurantibacillus circumpalustris]|uniref:PKD domain-containing protein n=1 Tax=Aurantibacillus circumpalustris TaxID=3036359 RepID=UPI00295AED16|nr:PKD domain-containing protein [Aurantibacillus circumpalustris]
MYKQKLIQSTFLFLIFVFSESFSQITLTPSAGCAPLSVVFSGPSGASAVSWTLGSGLGTSTLSSPNTLYTTPGSYNITYTAIVAGSPVLYSSVLLVSQGPSANFSAVLPSSHCVPMIVNFSASGGPPGAVYSWAFGDLTALGTGASVSHTYNIASSFVPVVTVFDPVSMCTALATSNSGTIYVSTPPSTLVLSSNGFIGCAPPFTTNINGSGSSSGSPIPGGQLTYNWTFTGGTPASSGGANPGQISFGQGVNLITLQLTDNNQCSNSGTVAVAVVNPSLTATIPGTVCLNGPVPATIQTSQNNVTFNAQSLGLFSFPTNPNGTTFIDTVCFFTAPGIHTLNVSVQTGGGCPPISVLKTTFVEQVSPDFTLTPPHSTCTKSMIASYINISSSNTGAPLTFIWTATFPPNSSHSVSPASISINNMGNVTFTFYQGSANPYTIYQYFNPNITLVAQSTSIAHCSSGKVHNEFDTIARPSALFNVDKRNGCVPLTVKYRDSSFTAPSNHIVSYTWCNGATPSVTVSGNTPLPPASNAYAVPPQTFVYNTPGTYYPYLVINTLFGCTDTSFVDTIIVVNPPTVSATFPANACAGTPVTISLTGSGLNTPSSSGIDHWHVNTDNQMFSGCITNSSPTFSFSHVGTHTVSVSAYQANCGATTNLVPTIQIKGPYGKFQFENTCVGNKFSVDFNLHLQEVSTATLYFGDGANSVIPGNASANIGVLQNHIYPNTGNFTVTLKTENSITGCSHLFSRIVKIRDPKAKITYAGQPFPTLPNALACVNTKYMFDAPNSIDVKAGCKRGYVWNFQAPGSPGYTLHPLELGAASFSTGFIPLQVPPPNDTLHIMVDKIALDTFRVAGIYTISLMVIDDNGCTDTETKVFRIGDAVPHFTFSANPICKTGQPVQIINTTQANQVAPDVISNYNWDFGDGNLSNSTNPNDSPTHTYLNVFPPSQVFSVTCTATNAPLGCKGKTTHTLQINNPVPGFNTGAPFVCVPKNQSGTVLFTANAGYVTYSVNYGTGTPPLWTTFNGNFNGAGVAYSVPGSYTPTLTVTDAAGCKATETIAVAAIGQPTAVIKFIDDKQSFCVPGQPTIVSKPLINVTPVTLNIWSVLNFTGPAGDTVPQTFPPGIHNISLTVYAGGYCPSTTTANVYVYDPKAIAFAVDNKTTICLGEPLVVSIKDFNDVYEWKWFFGDNVNQSPIFAGSTVNGTVNPTVSYPYLIFPTTGENGFTTVNLYYSPPIKVEGCDPVSSFSIHVIKVNADFKNQLDKYEHCLKISDSFTNTTPNPTSQNFEATWDFGDKTPLISGINSVGHTYTLAGVYPVNIMVKDKDYGCVGNTIKQMTIFPLPKADISITPTLNCPDATFTVTGSGTPGVSGTLTGTLSSYAGALPLNLAPANSFSTTTASSITTTYTLKVTDENTCESDPVFSKVNIIPPAPTIRWDTSVVIGKPTPLNAFVGPGYSYTWTPLITDLDCDTCILPNPISTSTVNITYTVEVEDELYCSVIKNTYHINIIPKVSIDVPTAFTPNGDGINDVIFPDGWGIRKLIYFKVFNRWGQLIFESNDIKIGWDGVFQGIPQNMETYVYQVSVETYLDTEPILDKSGTFKLLR